MKQNKNICICKEKQKEAKEDAKLTQTTKIKL